MNAAEHIILLGGTLAVAPAFSPADVSGLAAWYDPSDLSTLFQDTAGTTPVVSDGDPVARVNDKSGNNRNLLQGTSSKRPLYKTSGGLSWLLFDGVDDNVSAAFTTTFPYVRVSAFRTPTGNPSGHYYGGVTANSDVLYQNALTLNNYQAGNAINGPSVTASTDYCVTERKNGASSRLAVNNGSYSTGTLNTISGGGVTIGGSAFTGADNIAIRFYGSAHYFADPTDPNIALLRTYFGAKAGLTL